MDGYIARQTKTASKLGATFDSVADFIFISIMLFILIPIINLSFWLKLWLIGIAAIKVVSLLIGLIKYHSLAFLHTYLNKSAGASLFIFPILYNVFGMTIAFFLVCSIATLAAVEELIINIISKELAYDIKSIFFM